MVDEISAAEKIPKSFLAKIFQLLAKDGLVRSHRGAGGGFSLARPPGEINLLQVLNCVEKAFALQRCVTDDPRCVVSHRQLRSCALCAVYSEAQNRVNEVFSRTSLQNLLTPKPGAGRRPKTTIATL
jgi:Rrf2 family protein